MSAISDVQGAIDSALNTLGTSPVQSNQVAHNDPLAIVGSGVKHWYSSMQWLMSKFTDNLSKHSVSSVVPGSYASFLQTCDALVQTVQQKLSQDPTFADLPNAFSSFITNPGSLFSNPAQAIRGEVSAIVKLIGDVALLLLKAIKTAADTFLETLPSLFAAIKDLLNQEIHVFGISELWKVISGDALTLLDLGALLVALPFSIITNATGVKKLRRVPGTNSRSIGRHLVLLQRHDY